MSKQHTATPWDAKPTAGGHQHIIWDKTGKTIAVVYTDASDAAHIVHAVNSHAALVEALEHCLNWCNHSDVRHYISTKLGEQADIHATINRARAALNLARED